MTRSCGWKETWRKSTRRVLRRDVFVWISARCASACCAQPPMLARRLRTVARQAQSLADAPSDNDLYAVRNRTKRARYAAEAASPLLGKRARVVGFAAAELQDVLGEYRDAAVAERW